MSLCGFHHFQQAANLVGWGNSTALALTDWHMLDKA